MKLSDFPAHVQERIIRENPQVFGRLVGLRPEVSERESRTTLEPQAPRTQARRSRVATGHRPVARVGIVTFTRKAHDLDNVIAGCKGLRDEIAESLGTDDNERCVEWWYHTAVGKRAGTLIIMELR